MKDITFQQESRGGRHQVVFLTNKEQTFVGVILKKTTKKVNILYFIRKHIVTQPKIHYIPRPKLNPDWSFEIPNVKKNLFTPSPTAGSPVT